MKKLISLLLALNLVMSLATTVFAADNNGITQPANNTATVKATYSARTEAETVYSVSIAWGELSFHYSEGSEGTWNSSTQEYENVVDAGWSWTTENNNNRILIHNSSNTALDAALSFKPANGLDVAGVFKDAAAQNAGNEIADNTLSLTSAESTGEATTACAYFHVTGGSITQSGDIGTITVTLSNGDEAEEKETAKPVELHVYNIGSDNVVSVSSHGVIFYDADGNVVKTFNEEGADSIVTIPEGAVTFKVTTTWLLHSQDKMVNHDNYDAVMIPQETSTVIRDYKEPYKLEINKIE